VHLFIFLTLSVTVWREFPRSMARRRRTNCLAPSFSWSYPFGLFSLVYVKETRWMKSKHWAPQQLQMLQRTCYCAYGKGGLWVGCAQSYMWRSLWSVSQLKTFLLVCKKTFSVDE
jgi:hypothetical protein